MTLVGEQWHGSSHEVLTDAEEHHSHRRHQLLNAATGLQANFMVAVLTAVLQDLSDLSTIRCNSLHAWVRQMGLDLTFADQVGKLIQGKHSMHLYIRRKHDATDWQQAAVAG